MATGVERVSMVPDMAESTLRAGAERRRVEASQAFQFFNRLDTRKTAVFPALEGVAPLVAEAYEKDHRGLDAAFDSLSKAVSARDALGTARAGEKGEDRIIKERVPVPDQAAAVGVMAGSVPAERNPELIAWMYPLLGGEDRENMTRVWQMVMPPAVFGGAIQLVHQAIGDDFAELTRRIPGLAA